ncbi:MAG: cupin domain-containing protein [Gemmatimonadota bacterium]
MNEQTEGAGAAGRSRVLRFADFRWDGVEPRSYKDPDEKWQDVMRHPLIGVNEDTPFHLRYFEIEPGGYTTFERHAHQHVVVAIRGQGEVRLGDSWEPVSFGDIVYVAPNHPHQFRAAGDAPFGFLCIVEAERDRPVAL